METLTAPLADLLAILLVLSALFAALVLISEGVDRLSALVRTRTRRGRKAHTRKRTRSPPLGRRPEPKGHGRTPASLAA